MPATAQSRHSRRSVLAGGAAFVSAAGVGGTLLSVATRAKGAPQITLEPRVTEFELIAGNPTRRILSYSDAAPAPVLRVKQGERLSVLLRNRLPEPTTIHWHGIRLPNAVDGVPFLTQPYVLEGQTFEYAFNPPDAGSYWYHPHCNSLQQLSFGLTGLLIVEEAADAGFDAEIALDVRDWRIGPDGQFINLYVPRQTARAGTFGTHRTANWRQEPTYDAPSGCLARLRIVVTDVTRVCRLAVEGAPALIIALDGNPLPQPMALDTFPVGPGQRMDLAVRMPDAEGETVRLRDHSSQPPASVARLRAVGASRRRDLREVRALPPNPLAEPDLTSATQIPLEFTATAEQVPKSRICGDLGYSFWAINRTPWPGSSPDPLAPIAELKLGKSYVLSMHNRTPHTHPIHLHGLAFKPIRSDRRTPLPVWTDTALLLPDERLDVALVADSAGDWLLHCHVLEHQETGMTGYFRIA